VEAAGQHGAAEASELPPPAAAARSQAEKLRPSARPKARLFRDDEPPDLHGLQSALPTKQRAAVVLHKYQELDYKQIAQALGCSESAVKSLLFRAYEALRVRLNHLAGGRS